MLKNERAHESRRERSKREKLERIERAARRLFAENGYDSTTTRAIADAAEIGTGTLFVYFPEKLDLLVHLYHQDLERVVMGTLDALPVELPIAEACARVFDAAYDFYAEDRALARTFVKELMFLDLDRQQEMVRLTFRFTERLAALVTAAQERGEVSADVGAPLAASQLFGLYYWGLIAWLTDRVSRRQLSTFVRMSIDLLMRGMATRDDRAREEPK